MAEQSPPHLKHHKFGGELNCMCWTGWARLDDDAHYVAKLAFPVGCSAFPFDSV